MSSRAAALARVRGYLAQIVAGLIDAACLPATDQDPPTEDLAGMAITCVGLLKGLARGARFVPEHLPATRVCSGTFAGDLGHAPDCPRVLEVGDPENITHGMSEACLARTRAIQAEKRLAARSEASA